MMIGTVMGKMKRGTVSWLNSAKLAKTFAVGSGVFSRIMWIPNVTRVTIAEDAWVKNAATIFCQL